MTWGFDCAVGCRAYLHNPVTNALEVCAVKSLDAELALTDSRGCAGVQADALHEAEGMRRVAGAVDVAGFRGLIITANDSVHLLMEYVPLCPIWIWICSRRGLLTCACVVQ
jgi:hypothetical protein